MGIASVVRHVGTILNQEAFPNRIFEYGYDVLASGGFDYLAVVRFATASHAVDTYGDGWLREWTIEVQVYSFFDTPIDAHKRLTESLDKLVTAIEKFPHLNQGSGGDIRMAMVDEIQEVRTIFNEEGTVSSIMSPVFIKVQEEETTVAAE